MFAVRLFRRTCLKMNWGNQTNETSVPCKPCFWGFLSFVRSEYQHHARTSDSPPPPRKRLNQLLSPSSTVNIRDDLANVSLNMGVQSSLCLQCGHAWAKPPSLVCLKSSRADNLVRVKMLRFRYWHSLSKGCHCDVTFVFVGGSCVYPWRS
jgi:hypothetical protein